MAEQNEEISNKTYLGDGVFVKCADNWFVVLSTENGISITNQVYMEPDVVKAFKAWLARHKEEKS